MLLWRHFVHVVNIYNQLWRSWRYDSFNDFGLGAGGKGDDRGWDGWMASPTQWTWVWVNSGSWWWTGRPGVLQFMGLQRVRHDWATELNSRLILIQCSPFPMNCVCLLYNTNWLGIQLIWAAAYQAPPSLGFSRQKYWSRVPFASLLIEL